MIDSPAAMATLLLVSSIAVFATPDLAPAAPEPDASPPVEPSFIGQANCRACHVIEADHWAATVHARLPQRPRNDLEKLGCEGCHGPGSEHAKAPSKRDRIVSFTRESESSVEAMNGMCLGCHSGGTRIYWSGSANAREELACSDCHNPMTEPLVIRPVRVVAVEATFDDRGVLPEEGPTLFGVALITELIDAIGAQKRVRGRTVWRVTIAAGDLAFGQRHVGALAKLCALLGVTGETGLRDTLLPEKAARRLLGHRIVAVATSEPLPLVGRSVPVDARSTRVTSEAHAVHRLDARRGFSRERNHSIALGRSFRVLGTRPVAPLASEFFEIVVRSLRQARVDGGRPVVGLDDMARATVGLTDEGRLDGG